MSSATNADWPEINSVNLDDMLNQPLPTIDRQITNLLIWATNILEDDHLGSVDLPEKDELTSVVGTIDGGRVDQLISQAANDGFIAFIRDDCISVTAKGWARLETPVVLEGEAMSDPAKDDSAANVDRIIKANCNRCRGLTNSWVRAQHIVAKSDGPISWSDGFEVLQCCGCDSLSVRKEHWFSEWDAIDYDEYGRLMMRPGIEETYYPAPTVRAKPIWSDSVEDEVLRNVLDELFSALNGGMSVLASVGARTLLDRAGFLLIGDPPGGFEGKLSALQKDGYISAQEKKTLEAVADAGSASAHRGYTPTAERLGHIADIMENFLHRAFILPLAAEEIRKSTPARQKRT